MTFAEGRRPATPAPRIVGRAPTDYARELEEFLQRLFAFTADGIPPGFTDTDPTEIQAGATADPGSETSGWAAADHTHEIATASPTYPTQKTADEGTGTALMRADAKIAQGIVTTKGDLLTHDGSTAERLAVGTALQVLTANAAQPTGLKWETIPTTSWWRHFMTMGG